MFLWSYSSSFAWVISGSKCSDPLCDPATCNCPHNRGATARIRNLRNRLPLPSTPLPTSPAVHRLCSISRPANTTTSANGVTPTLSTPSSFSTCITGCPASRTFTSDTLAHAGSGDMAIHHICRGRTSLRQLQSGNRQIAQLCSLIHKVIMSGKLPVKACAHTYQDGAMRHRYRRERTDRPACENPAAIANDLPRTIDRQSMIPPIPARRSPHH